MNGFTFDPKSGRWFSPDQGGIWYDPDKKEYYSVAHGVWTVGGRWPQPTRPPSAQAANGGQRTGGMMGTARPGRERPRVRGRAANDVWPGQEGDAEDRGTNAGDRGSYGPGFNAELADLRDSAGALVSKWRRQADSQQQRADNAEEGSEERIATESEVATLMSCAWDLARVLGGGAANSTRRARVRGRSR